MDHGLHRRGFDEHRALTLMAVVLDGFPKEKAEPFDDEDIKFMDSIRQDIAELKAMGIDKPIFTIPQM